MKKLLFLLLIFIPIICLASAFKPRELKINHYYYVHVLKDDYFRRSFVDKVLLVSKKNNIYIVAITMDNLLGWKIYNYQQVKLDQILGEVKQ